jgi:dipeptidyl aminopeptidase/acylaminoacyl peptidase
MRRRHHLGAIAVDRHADRAARQAQSGADLDDLSTSCDLSSDLSRRHTHPLHESEIKKWKDNKRVATVWVASADGPTPISSLAGQDQSPGSPDGKLVAFLSTRDAGAGEPPREGQDGGGGQIWLIPSAGGEAWKLTSNRGNIRTFEWSADSTSLLFAAGDSKSDDQKASEKAGDDAVFVDEGPNGQSSGAYSNLWVVGIADKKERQITRDKMLIGDFEPARWHSLALTYHRGCPDRYLTEIAVVDVDRRPEGPHQNRRLSGLRWSPGGATVCSRPPAPRRGIWKTACSAAAGGLTRRGPTRHRRHPRALAPDGASIYFAASSAAGQLL